MKLERISRVIYLDPTEGTRLFARAVPQAAAYLQRFEGNFGSDILSVIVGKRKFLPWILFTGNCYVLRAVSISIN